MVDLDRIVASAGIFHWMPAAKKDIALKLGWMTVPYNGVRDGIPVQCFLWPCDCKLVVPI